MSDSRTVTAQNAIDAVARYVRSDWMSRWQKLDPENDDGIDGMIFLRKMCLDRKNTKSLDHPKYCSIPMRGVVYVQVKGGKGYVVESQKRPEHIQVQVGQEYIEQHRPRWNAMSGPVIMIYVDTENKKQNLDAWWVDLKDDASYSNENHQIVLFPRSQRFGPHSKGHIKNLVGPEPYDEQLVQIRADRDDISYVQFNRPLKQAAREFYHYWANLPPSNRTNPALGEILISRVGWRHITRRGRRPERINQSLQLLGVAKRIINDVDLVGWLGRIEEANLVCGGVRRDELLSIRARVTFPHRHPSVVHVVLKRSRYYASDGTSFDKVWFYSVYEVRRQV